MNEYHYDHVVYTFQVFFNKTRLGFILDEDGIEGPNTWEAKYRILGGEPAYTASTNRWSEAICAAVIVSERGEIRS